MVGVVQDGAFAWLTGLANRSMANTTLPNLPGTGRIRVLRPVLALQFKLYSIVIVNVYSSWGPAVITNCTVLYLSSVPTSRIFFRGATVSN